MPVRGIGESPDMRWLRASAPIRFWGFVGLESSDSCWNWVGARDRHGYGRFQLGIGHGVVQSHRYAFELLVGPIPSGLQLDHLCRNPSCVNPAHLEPVTARVNTLRGNTVTAANAAKTHCLRGHPLSGHNLLLRKDNSSRTCRVCKYASNANHIRRRRVA